MLPVHNTELYSLDERDSAKSSKTFKKAVEYINNAFRCLGINSEEITTEIIDPTREKATSADGKEEMKQGEEFIADISKSGGKYAKDAAETRDGRGDEGFPEIVMELSEEKILVEAPQFYP